VQKPLAFDYTYNKEQWDVVKDFQPLPPKNKEASLDGLKTAFKDCSLPYATDIENYGYWEYFATPDMYKYKGKGDCEDFAICVYYKAKEMGVRDVYLIFGDNGYGKHVAAQVTIDGKTYIADNNRKRLIDSHEYYKSFKLGLVLN
jgi:hypothetical protein